VSLKPLTLSSWRGVLSGLSGFFTLRKMGFWILVLFQNLVMSISKEYAILTMLKLKYDGQHWSLCSALGPAGSLKLDFSYLVSNTKKGQYIRIS
jgi:hypothetical protein